MTDNANLIDPSGRVVMISGASRGIGEAIAKKLLADGYCASLGVRDVAATAERFSQFDGDKLLIDAFDAGQPDTAQSWLENTLRTFGKLHGLVNNAGIWRQVNFDAGDEGDLDALWEVNVKGPFRLTRHALPHLRACGNGRIVNIASTDGVRFRDTTCSVGYTMSKHALMAMSHAARQFGYDDGVRVTALCPGAVATELIAGVPGVTPAAGQLAPETIAHIVATVMALPNNASVAWMPVNTRLESTI